jgi:WXXGXW repeat (2 copies)
MIPNRCNRSRLFRLLFFALVVLAASAASFAQVGISITIGPPALPVYEQPPCPAEGYIWTPGYWAYNYDIGDYYWVPGTWVLAPEVGFLWTPGWWGWGGGGVFLFHEGYWGPRVGFYGGIVYGFGYFGEGYEGGRWENGRFFYNRSVNNVNVTNIHNVYNTTVINNTTVNRVSYNGGNGGINARPTAEQEAAERERHIPPVAAQTQHVQAARANPELRASANHGKPPIAATARPGALNDRAAVVPAKEAGAPYNAGGQRANQQPGHPENNVPRPGNNEQGGHAQNNVPRPGNNEQAPHPENNVPRPPATHAKDLQPHERPAPPNTGNAKTDQKYQQQQEKLYQKQEQEHQKLQQKQEQDHQRLAQQNANEARKQQVEQQHQQQTQQMEQKHAQQQEKMQTKQGGQKPAPPK